MVIHRTATPGGIENLFSFLPVPIPTLKGDYQTKDLKTSASPVFWTQLFSDSGASWPAIYNATVRVGRVPSGFIFSLDAGKGLVALGGGALESGGQAWTELQRSVLEFRKLSSDDLLSTPGGPELMHSWENQPLLPAEGPWLTLVPMLGMRYYTPEANRILQLTTDLGHDLLFICKQESSPQ